MAGELTKAVRSRYRARISAGGEDFSGRVLAIDGFVEDVIGRWEEAGAWIATHLASFREPAGEDDPDELSPAPGSRSLAEEDLSFSRGRGPRVGETAQGNARPRFPETGAETAASRAGARRAGAAGAAARVSSDEWSFVDRALGPLGSRKLDIPAGLDGRVVADVSGSGGLFESRGLAAAERSRSRPSGRPVALAERQAAPAGEGSFAEALRRSRAEREWESRGF